MLDLLADRVREPVRVDGLLVLEAPSGAVLVEAVPHMEVLLEVMLCGALRLVLGATASGGRGSAGVARRGRQVLEAA